MPRPVIPNQKSILVNGQQMADILLIGRQTVEKLAKEGAIPRHAPGRYDVLKVVPAFLQYEHQRKGLIEQTPTRAFNESRADLYKARAEREKLQLGLARGDLLEASAVTQTLSNAFSLVRARLLGIGAKLSPRLSLINSVAKIRGLIDAEITLALNELATCKVVETDAARGSRNGSDDLEVDEDVEAAADVDGGAVGRRAPPAERRGRRLSLGSGLRLARSTSAA